MFEEKLQISFFGIHFDELGINIKTACATNVPRPTEINRKLQKSAVVENGLNLMKS